MFKLIAGDQAKFSCEMSSSSSYWNEIGMALVEVTNEAANVSDQRISNTVTDLKIPRGRKRCVRKFVCEMRDGSYLVRSEVAELIIVSAGKIINSQ